MATGETLTMFSELINACPNKFEHAAHAVGWGAADRISCITPPDLAHFHFAISARAYPGRGDSQAGSS